MHYIIEAGFHKGQSCKVLGTDNDGNALVVMEDDLEAVVHVDGLRENLFDKYIEKEDGIYKKRIVNG